MKRILPALLLLWGSTLSAQTFPEPSAVTVNDFADMIAPDLEARLTEKLDTYQEQTGVEIVVVTLSSVQFYANDMSVADYAKALFDDWGVGAEGEDTGQLLLVFRDDRELRIQLGAGYGEIWNSEARNIVNIDILPQFRNDQFGAGIEAGANSMMTRIAAPFIAGEDTPPPRAEASQTGGGSIWIWLGGIVAVIAGLIGWSRRKAAKEPCENCGKPGLERSSKVLVAATETSEGEGQRLVSCPSCGHVKRTTYSIPRVKPPEETGPHGGGKAGDGGASGKW